MPQKKMDIKDLLKRNDYKNVLNLFLLMERAIVKDEKIVKKFKQYSHDYRVLKLPYFESHKNQNLSMLKGEAEFEKNYDESMLNLWWNLFGLTHGNIFYALVPQEKLEKMNISKRREHEEYFGKYLFESLPEFKLNVSQAMKYVKFENLFGDRTDELKNYSVSVGLYPIKRGAINSPQRLNTILNRLIDEGIIITKGNRRYRKYFLNREYRLSVEKELIQRKIESSISNGIFPITNSNFHQGKLSMYGFGSLSSSQRKELIKMIDNAVILLNELEKIHRKIGKAQFVITYERGFGLEK